MMRALRTERPRIPLSVVRSSLCLGCLVWGMTLSHAQIVLQVEEQGPDQRRITWTGGTGPYTVYKANDPRMTAAVEITPAGLQLEAIVWKGTAAVTFYRVGDIAAPSVTIQNPSSGEETSFSPIIFNGTVDPPTATINLAGRTALRPGSGCSPGAIECFWESVELASDFNTIWVAGLLGDGNISVTPIDVIWNNTNFSPSIQIQSWDDCDRTPSIVVTFSDFDEGDQIDFSNFRAYLDGSDVTSFFDLDEVTQDKATWNVTYSTDPQNDQSLGVGPHSLRVFISDTRGGYGSATRTFTTTGPHISNISPLSGRPDVSVDLTGCGFGSLISEADVRFNSTSAVITPGTLTSTLMRVTVPYIPTNGPLTEETVTVTVDGKSSNVFPFDVAFFGAFPQNALDASYLAIDYQDRVYISGSGGFAGTTPNPRLYRNLFSSQDQ